MIRVAVCSPIPALRAGLRALIGADPDLVVAASAASLAELAELRVEVQVAVCAPGGAPINAPDSELAVLLVSGDVEEARGLAALGLPAWGVLSPEAPAEALQSAVRALSEGLLVLSPGMAAHLLIPLAQAGVGELDIARSEPLTARETEVLAALAQGLTNKQIAAALHISEHTVKFHVSAVYARLGVSNRAEAVRRGARSGLVPL